jgi:hypothetical protein
MIIHLTTDINHLIKLSFNTPKFIRGLDPLSVKRCDTSTMSGGRSRWMVEKEEGGELTGVGGREDRVVKRVATASTRLAACA